MSDVLMAEKRELSFSTGELNQMRKAGKVPGIIYGKGSESIPLFVNLLEFRNTYQKNGKIFEIKLGDTTELVNTKVIDTTPFGKISHINFHKLVKGEKTTVKVPITLIGEAAGKSEGGMIQQIADMVMINATPKNIPSSIEVDISEMKVGDTITLADIKLAGDLELAEDGEGTLATCTVPKQAAAEPATEEGDGEAVDNTDSAQAPEAAQASDAGSDDKSEA